jgi:hypothetical protein
MEGALWPPMNADETKIAYLRSSAFIGGDLFSLASRNWQAKAPAPPLEFQRRTRGTRR